MSRDVRARLRKVYVSDSVGAMIGQERLAYFAISASIGVLAAMWVMKDSMIKSVAVPSEWTRQRWLRLRGMEEYVGRHRYA